MSEQNVVDAPSQKAADDRGNQNFGSEDFGNRDFGNREFGRQDFGNEDFGNRESGNGESNASGETTPHGQGQSKSSRRRRRKRKGKVDGPGGSDSAGAAESESPALGAPVVMAGESLALAAAAAPAHQRRQSASQQPQGQPQGQAQGTAGKRWKKKFRDRERRPGTARNENPGNDFRADAGNGGGVQNGFAQNNGANYGSGSGNGGGFKRKGKQGPRKERGGFVGPMDHSYREVNGNFADPSQSTVQMNGAAFGGRKGHRHHGDSQPIDHSMPRAIPIPENAQTHIYFFIEDLFFTAKIQETARKQGVKVAFIKNEKDAVAELTGGAEENKPALIVFDLNNVNAKPLTLIPKLKTKLKKTVSIIGFLSHLQGDLKAKAVEAGCDAVMPRAAFSQNLPNLLRRYSVEESEEVNYNQ
ncbi:MAG: response regulator [Acidobacteriaceae bacterium]